MRLKGRSEFEPRYEAVLSKLCVFRTSKPPRIVPLYDIPQTASHVLKEMTNNLCDPQNGQVIGVLQF